MRSIYACYTHFYWYYKDSYPNKHTEIATHMGREKIKFNYQKPASPTLDTHFAWLGEIVDWHANMKPLSSPLELTHQQSFDLWEVRDDHPIHLRGGHALVPTEECRSVMSSPGCFPIRTSNTKTLKL